MVIGCVGGGSNFAGLAFPWLRRNLRNGSSIRFIGAEPAACPTLTQGTYAYDFGEVVRIVVEFRRRSPGVGGQTLTGSAIS